MPDITWANVVAFAAELSAVQPQVQMDILAFVNKLNPNGFGGETSPKFKLARIYRAAHMAWMTPGVTLSGSGVAGPVTRKTVSGDSYTVEYSDAAAASEDSLELTEYGLEYLKLASTSLSRLPFTP